jgi:hypothetical protein
MTTGERADSFGPYAFALAPAEIEAAAERFGLRIALRGGLIVRHAAPLAIFALTLLFASTLALTGFISRRAGEATIILAALAFMIQRAANRWRIRRARLWGREAMASLQPEGGLTAAFEEDSVTLEGAGRKLRLNYADCEDAENAGGLIYVWRRKGVPVVVPTRVLGGADEAGRLVAEVAGRIGRTRRNGRPGR